MKKILLADDEKNFAEVLRSELEEAGYGVTLTRDGVEAVIKALDDKFDMALLDIMMPNLDGINTVRILKKIDPRLPIITFSGVAGSGDMASSIRAGAIRCITKPFSVEQLLSEIKRVLHE
ncbi:MAG: response regulator [Deltaproteobacteria bacterium]|nr:response regulator [Deltaproteobacteria bacterium]